MSVFLVNVNINVNDVIRNDGAISSEIINFEI